MISGFKKVVDDNAYIYLRFYLIKLYCDSHPENKDGKLDKIDRYAKYLEHLKIRNILGAHIKKLMVSNIL
jgi:hypothetical protein